MVAITIFFQKYNDYFKIPEFVNRLKRVTIVYHILIPFDLSFFNFAGDVRLSGASVYGEIGEVIRGVLSLDTNSTTIFKSVGKLYTASFNMLACSRLLSYYNVINTN